jgi:uncharacterized protein YkwD
MRLLSLALLASLLAALALSAPALAAGHDAVDLAVIRAINAERTQRGLPALRTNAGLARTADRHSASMAHSSRLEHGNVEGRLRKVIAGGPVGETIALVPGSASALARNVVRMWMRSPPHRAILLEPRVRRVGVGRARSGGSWYVTADFAGAG